MYVSTLDPTNKEALKGRIAELVSKDPAWVLMYGVEDSPFDVLMGLVRERLPRTPIFGATSFQGVFSPAGFHRHAGILAAEAADHVNVGISLKETGPERARESAREACREIEQALGRRPSVLLLHATPGFEERILEGVNDGFGSDVPVYGGSAADDKIAGRWRVFADGRVATQGLVLAGLSSNSPIAGGFLGGYLPTHCEGVVTKVSGRIVHEIDGRPAAVVYNEWTEGVIAAELGGGNVLLKTNLHPVARSIGRAAMPRRLLSHPHEVTKTNGLAFFTELAQGERLTLMTGARDPLVTRVRRTVQRARTTITGFRPRAGLMVYCGGCLSILLDKATTIAQEFHSEIGGVPFLGIATFGEQGTFFQKSLSYHGNLMCSAVLF